MVAWLIDQSHRCGHRQAACREPAGSYDKTTRTAICFEHKTQYLLIRAPYTHIVVFWHISKIAPMIGRVKLVVIPPCFVKQLYLWNIAIQLAVGFYNSWANLRSSGCYPLGEKLLWNRSISSPAVVISFWKETSVLSLSFNRHSDYLNICSVFLLSLPPRYYLVGQNLYAYVLWEIVGNFHTTDNNMYPRNR